MGEVSHTCNNKLDEEGQVPTVRQEGQVPRPTSQWLRCSYRIKLYL